MKIGKQVKIRVPVPVTRAKAPQKKKKLQAPKIAEPKPQGFTVTEKAPRLETQASPEPATTAVVSPPSPERAFMESLTENLCKEEVSQLGARAVATMQGRELEPGTRLEQVLAAHTYNHVKGSLRESLPDVPAKKLLTQARKHPDLKGRAQLLQATSQFLRAERNPVEQARERADAVARQQEWSKGLAQMREENRLTAARIHKIMTDAMQSVSETMLSIFSNRLKKASHHNKQWTYLMTEVWPKS